MKPIYLRTARKKRRWTQTRLAQISHVGQNQISRLETKPPKRLAFEEMLRLAEALGVPVHALRAGPDPKDTSALDDRRRV